jgi:hypothetical protein
MIRALLLFVIVPFLGCVRTNSGYYTPDARLAADGGVGLDGAEDGPTMADVRARRAGDGAACVSRTFFRDRDGDGYGDPSFPTARCERPAGFVANSGDCDDTNAKVHPGQKGFFADPAAAADGFDYNCDAREESEYAGAVSCKMNGDGSCSGHGWINAPPACGERALFGECQKAWICYAAMAFRRQRCR